MKKIIITWDIPEEGTSDDWVVLIWMIEEGKTATIINQINKNSSNLASITIPLSIKENKNK